jgi:hypothetical protein
VKQIVAEDVRVGDTVKVPGGPSVRAVGRELVDGQVRLALWADQNRQIRFLYVARDSKIEWAAHPRGA